MIDVTVIGSGVAGTAACLAAAAAGANVRLLLGGSGASALASGALDTSPWEEGSDSGPDAAPALDAAAARVLDDLAIYRVSDRPALLATTAGIVRPARGRDAALLDLAALRNGAVLLPRCDQHGWDASALARAWNDAPSARARGLTFVPVDAQITRFREERTLPDAEIAERHDDPSRLAWLGERLRDVLTRGGEFAAVLMPPWLGAEAPRASDLSSLVGVPCGECIGQLAGPAGLRFAHARDRAFAGTDRIEVVDGWVRAIEREPDGFRVELEGDRVLHATRVVLACGGVLAGGLRYDPSDALLAAAVPSAARSTFRFTIDGLGEPGADGRPLDLPGSLFGAAPEGLAWPFDTTPLIERVGMLTHPDGRAARVADGVFACGDFTADRPRTWLDALTTGALAGALAAAR